jgi:uncharacterized membrane protein YccC
VRANRNYLATIAAALAQSEPFAGVVVQKKREAERANSQTAASLQRMLGEPTSRQRQVERAAALTAYNQRLTRAATGLAVYLNQRAAFREPEFLALSGSVGEALESLARQIETGTTPERLVHFSFQPQANLGDAAALVYGQMERIITEIEAMALAKDAPAGPEAKKSTD